MEINATSPELKATNVELNASSTEFNATSMKLNATSAVGNVTANTLIRLYGSQSAPSMRVSANSLVAFLGPVLLSWIRQNFMTSEDNSIKLMATHMLRLAIIAEFTFI